MKISSQVPRAVSRAPVTIARPPDDPVDIVPTPDGREILITVGHDALGHHPRTIYSVDANGHDLKNLTPGIRVYEQATISPDSKKIVYVEHDQHSDVTDLHVMNVDGGYNTNITPTHGGFWEPQWSPGGGELLVSSTQPKTGKSDLFLMSPDGKHRTLLMHSDTGHFYNARFTPDGLRVAFLSDVRRNEYELYSIRTDGSDLQAHTPGMTVEDGFTLSPDGHAAFSASPKPGTLAFDVYTVNLWDGSAPQQITNNGWALAPCYSPDGSHLAYLVSASADHSRLQIVESKPDGSEARPIASACGPMAWMPNGQSIVYADYPSDGGPAEVLSVAV